MISKIKQILINPKLFFLYLILLSRKLQVKKIEKNGAVFYRYKGDFYPEYLNNGNACSFILEKAKHFCQGKGIDVGADAWPFPGAVPVLNDKNQNAYQLDRFSDNSLDYVFSSHCLEHLEKWETADSSS